MKKISLLLLVVVFFSFNFGQSANAVPGRINGPKDLALYAVMKNRCNRYMPSQEKDQCGEGVKRVIQLLDYDIISFNSHGGFADLNNQSRDQEAFVFIAFRESLVNLLSDHNTSLYLQDLNQRLNMYLTGEDNELNIWELTLSHYKSPLEAAKIIAALFQDTSLKRLHLAYLERSGTAGKGYYEDNKELLSRVIETINMILDYSSDDEYELFYPKGLAAHLNRNIYHFYVPFYLALKLKTEGRSMKIALASPLMMTLSYEFITAASDYRFLFQDPSSLDPNTYHGKLQDILAGRSGAALGVGIKTPSRFFPLMQKSFARSTEEGVKLLLKL